MLHIYDDGISSKFKMSCFFSVEKFLGFKIAQKMKNIGLLSLKFSKLCEVICKFIPDRPHNVVQEAGQKLSPHWKVT